ncbi:uncharacterized protein METZ01_LOCUS177848 [marine metagenome]|uniref:Uncharacterized protein n=1 Tax=marine metagenome TaxID=408172 RepID=A0A382CGJ0_9ZZZZ
MINANNTGMKSHFRNPDPYAIWFILTNMLAFIMIDKLVPYIPFNHTDQV